MTNLHAKLSDWLTNTSQILLLIITSRAYYNFSYHITDLDEVTFDASFRLNQELVVPQLKSFINIIILIDEVLFSFADVSKNLDDVDVI